MAFKRYVETFDDGPGGWVRVVDNVQPPAALPVREGALWSFGPWWVDYNHAPPGAGYLQLLMCLNTKGPFGEYLREVGGDNRFVTGGFSRDLTDAVVSVRIKGELEAAGTRVCVLIQGALDGVVTGWIHSGQTIEVRTDYSDQSIRLCPDESQWTCLGARHDRQEYYGRTPLNRILADVNVNLYLILFPVTPRPMGTLAGDPHRLRPGKDYPVWPSSIAQGYVAVDTIQIAYP
ncbi:MAG: hypothetical protein HYS12_11630 [Planctomycetes bacterium]|nr:hypothetical protein [Planctomycetota bacterium]